MAAEGTITRTPGPYGSRQADIVRKPDAGRRGRALLLGYYGVNNLGDDLMLVCIERWLQNQGIDVTVLAEDANTVRTLQRLPAVQNTPLLGQWNVRSAWFRGLAPRVLKSIASCDMFVAGGGDIIRDSLGIRFFSYQVEKLILAALMGKPVYLVNVGITAPQTRYGRAVLSWLLPRCQQIIVRDRRSVQVCAQHGFPEPMFLPDIVTEFATMFPPSNIPPQERYLIVSLHANPDIYGSYALTEQRLKTLAGAIESVAARQDLRVMFVACQSTDGLDDHSIHRAITAMFRDPDRAVFHPWTSNPESISDLFAGAAGVIAMRLHAGILGHAFEKPVVALPYDKKVSEFADIAGVPALTAEMLDDAAVVMDVLTAALEKSSA